MKLILLSFILSATINLFAQKDIPSFGKIDKNDLTMKECDNDKDAEAYKLLDLGSVFYEKGNNFFRMRLEKRIRIKILKEKGIKEADIKIRFYSRSSYGKIIDISAATYNLNDAGEVVITKLDKTSVYTKKINNRFSEVVFTMPDIKIGSVFEYKYADLRESISDLEDWYFQDDIPTRFSQYKISIPEIFRFTSNQLTYLPVEYKTEEANELLGTSEGTLRYVSSRKTYTMRNVPALREEPFMSTPKDYLQRLEFQLSQIVYSTGLVQEIKSSWPKLTEELLDDPDFGGQMKKNIPRTQELDKLLSGITDEAKKMIIIYDYVRRNMTWNGIAAFYTTDGIKSAWDKKSGTNSEINLILLDLLKDAKINAYPLLVSTHDNGGVNTFYPFLGQFNNVMAYVTIGDKFYVLNAADKYNPAILIPYDVIDTEGFIVDKSAGKWIILENAKQKYQNKVLIVAEINNEGMMQGEATVNSYDYSKNPRVKKWKEDEAKFKDYFTKDYTNISIENIEVNNIEKDSLPLEQKFKFSSQLNSSGDYKYFTLNLFNGLEKNPFIADKRLTDVDFGYKQSYISTGSITLPDNYKIDELPKNINMITPDTGIVFKRIMQMDENILNYRITLDFKNSIYAAADYPYFQEFYKKLFAELNEQMVITKK